MKKYLVTYRSIVEMIESIEVEAANPQLAIDIAKTLDATDSNFNCTIEHKDYRAKEIE